MNVLVYLVPIAIGLGLLGLLAFLWAMKTGQFDDLDGAAWRAISDDDLPDDEDKTEVGATGRPGPARQSWRATIAEWEAGRLKRVAFRSTRTSSRGALA